MSRASTPMARAKMPQRKLQSIDPVTLSRSVWGHMISCSLGEVDFVTDDKAEQAVRNTQDEIRRRQRRFAEEAASVERLRGAMAACGPDISQINNLQACIAEVKKLPRRRVGPAPHRMRRRAEVRLPMPRAIRGARA